MGIGIFYINNNSEDLLLVEINKKQEVKSHVKKEDIVLLYGQDKEIIGINIFNASKKIKLNGHGIYKLDTYLKDNISKLETELEFIKDLKTEKAVVVSKVTKCEPVKGTHLNNCIVFDGEKEYQVICGASNVKENIKVLFIKEGNYLPNGAYISKNKISGIQSNGMICSLKELGLEKESEGIHIVQDEMDIGTEFIKIYRNGEKYEQI
jgi:tRNA-binding protein